MRRNRIIYALIWISTLVLISFYGGSISYGLFYAVTAVPLVCLAYLIYVYTKFSILQQVIIKDIIAYRSIPYHFTLNNEGIFNFAGVKVNFFTDFSNINGLDASSEYELASKGKINCAANIVCQYRGTYEIGIKNLVLTDFLHLFTIKFKPLETVRVTVKPPIVDLDALSSFDLSVVTSRESVNDKIYPDVVVRDSDPQDPMRLINWKLTAREGKFKVREFIGEEKNGIAILTDTHRYYAEDTKYLPLENKILEITIALARFFGCRSIPASIHYLCPGYRAFFYDRIESFNDFYEAMTHVDFDTDNRIDILCGEVECSINLASVQSVIFVTACINDVMMNLITRLSNENIYVIIYYIGDDIDNIHELTDGLRLKLIPISVNDNIKEVL